MVSDVVLVKEGLSSGKLVIGLNSVLRGLRSGELVRVLVSRNAPVSVVEDLRFYSGLCGVEFSVFSGDSKELGVVCRKPFLVSVVGFRK